MGETRALQFQELLNRKLGLEDISDTKASERHCGKSTAPPLAVLCSVQVGGGEDGCRAPGWRPSALGF